MNDTLAIAFDAYANSASFQSIPKDFVHPYRSKEEQAVARAVRQGKGTPEKRVQKKKATTAADVPGLGPVPAGGFRWGFEAGDLQGWKIVEGAFERAVADNAKNRNGGAMMNKDGKYYLTTLETK